jgi:hypothetical protein
VVDKRKSVVKLWATSLLSMVFPHVPEGLSWSRRELSTSPQVGKCLEPTVLQVDTAPSVNHAGDDGIGNKSRRIIWSKKPVQMPATVP